MSFLGRSFRAFAVGGAVLVSSVACSDDGPMVAPEPTGPGYDSLTVNAAADWTYVTLGDPAQFANPGDPTTSSSWDIGFFATSVSVNGGAAGPAEVSGYCLCQNSGTSDAALHGLTAEGELGDFTAVTSADIPPDSMFEADELATVVKDWFSYNPQTHAVAPSNQVFLVRLASGDAIAKLQVSGMGEVGRSGPTSLTLKWAIQPTAGAAFGETQEMDVVLAAGAVHFDLDAGQTTTASDGGWDLWLEGWDIRVNGGVSGSGQAGALLVEDVFEDLDETGVPGAQFFRGDGFGGVFSSAPWYRYNLAGGHQIWPTYNVYLIKRGDVTYKVQIVSYYGASGDSRQITFRYAAL